MTTNWITPDDLYTDGYDCQPFIYNGIIFYSEKNINGDPIENTHYDLIKKYFPHLKEADNYNSYNVWTDLQSTALLGRAGLINDTEGHDNTDEGDIQVVSFWNRDKNIYDKLLQGCLEQLLEDNIINKDYFVSTPLVDTIPLSEVFNQQPKILNHAQQMQIDAKGQQHLNAGTIEADREKKELRGDAIKVNPDPFAKWKSMQSESIFDKKLTIILESL